MIPFQKKNWNRKAVSFSILLLVFTAVALAGLSLYYFHSLNDEIHENISLYNDVNSVIILKQELDSYLNEIFAEAVAGFTPEQGASVFVERFKKSLHTYQNKQGYYPVVELAQLEGLEERAVEISEDRLLLHVSALLEEKTSEMSVRYSYEKTFEKIFK
ncbi:MAG: hypothetical protein RL557_536 [archaeon]|jgi:hypothetical protein